MRKRRLIAALPCALIAVTAVLGPAVMAGSAVTSAHANLNRLAPP